jgi:hypothetical protein
MGKARRNQTVSSRRRTARAERIIRTITAGCLNPAEALELLYWSREPGLIEVIRGILTMPEDTRAALEAFIALARNTKTVSATLDHRGVLTLASSEASRALALAQHAAENDVQGVPRLLN